MIRRGFTLMEVNLAMFIMAVGTLGLVSLYSFGYRENQQSNEDVQGAATAESLMNTMIAALSSTNMTWNAWKGLGCQPSNGWGTYAGETSGTSVRDDGENSESGRSSAMTNPSGTAKQIFDAVMSAAGSSASFDAQNMACGIVINNYGNDGNISPKCSIAIRCGRRAGTLAYQPLYYTEVYFQGLKDENGGGGK